MIDQALPPMDAPATNDAGVAPKILGSDVELGNFVLGLELEQSTGAIASRALLREIRGLPPPQTSLSGSLFDLSHPCAEASAAPQGWGRRYLPSNGGCCYIDLDHLETCAPEVASAEDFAAASHAMLRIARAALKAANARLPDGLKLVAVVNNEDGLGHAYGSHMSVLMTRAGYDRLFHRRLQQLLTLASFQVSSIILTGQGKVNSGRHGGVGMDGHYEISQRASFFQCLAGPQTTYNRPLVNSRDEALCGRFNAYERPKKDLARLHCIFYDSSLCPASMVLRAGMMQIILSLLESGHAAPDLILEDPVETVAHWSLDPTLAARARLLSGKEVSALELQRFFLEKVEQFVGRGGCDGVVPGARDIVALWTDTLDKLAAGKWAELAPRLDWVLKLSLLEHAMESQTGLEWSSPEIKHLDFKYADLEEGLFWSCVRGGAVEAAGVTEERIQQLVRQPPENTRAWTRARLLRLAEPDEVEDVDWDSITFRLRAQNGMERRRTVALADPGGFTRRDTEAVFRYSESLEEALDLLGATGPEPETSHPPGAKWHSDGEWSTQSINRSSKEGDCSGSDGPTPSKP